MADLDSLSGRMLGEFVLRERLDEGGFGAVYRCEQPLLGRGAVIKVLHKRMRSRDAALKRFMREALLASRLDHPYAAHVYACGIEDDDGLLWIAMELVHGITLTRWLRERGPMPLDQFVPFFERVAEVVQAAHDRGIVHRDLKPSNVMIVERAGSLIPKLLDFGIARLLDEVALPTPEWPDTEKTPTMRRQPPSSTRSHRQLTSVDGLVGSPPYMSPEQWNNAVAAGPASDLYSLGVVAYEALTGRRPFDAKAGDTGEAISEYAELHRSAPIPPLGGSLSPALDGVIQRALAKCPEDRFTSALELASALRVALRTRDQLRLSAQQWHDEARPNGLLWRGAAFTKLERWARSSTTVALSEPEASFVAASRRHVQRASWIRRSLVALAAAALLAGIQYRVYLQARMAEEVAEARITEAEIEQGRQALLHDDSANARLHLAEAHRRGDRSPGLMFMLTRALQPRMAEKARFGATAGRMWSAAFSPDGTRIVTTDDKSAQVWDARTNQLVFTLPHGAEVYQAIYNRDGTQLVTVSASAVRIWRAADGTLVHELRREAGTASDYYLATISPDGKLVAAIDASGAVADVWGADTGITLAQLENDAQSFPSIAFSADGRWLATSGGSSVRVTDTRSWRMASELAGPGIRALSWDPTGARLLTGSVRGDASIWSVPSAERLRRLREVGEPVDRVAYAPNGELVVTASRDGSEQVWSTLSGELMNHINLLRTSIRSVEFDATSTLVVAAGGNAVAVSDAASGMPVTLLEGPNGAIWRARFDPQSRLVIGASWDGTARVWDAASPYRRWSSEPIGDECGLVVSHVPDERYIAVHCGNQPTQVWDTARNELLAKLPNGIPVGGELSTASPAVSVDGARAAIARGNAVDVYEIPGGRLLHTTTHPATVTTVAFGSAAYDLISGDRVGTVIITSETGDTMPLPFVRARVDDARLLADGRALVADTTRRLRIIDTQRGTSLADFELSTRIGPLRVSPDFRRLVAIPKYPEHAAPTLFDLERYQRIAELEGHVGFVFSARFVNAGAELLTAGADGAVRRWNGSTGRLTRTYQAPNRFLVDATLSPDSTLVVAGAADGLLRFWDAQNGRALWVLRAHRSHVVGVHYEGDNVVTRALAGDISRWSLSDPTRVLQDEDAFAR